MKFLHSMIRTNCPEESVKFYTEGLGLKLISKRDIEAGRFSLYFLGESEDSPMVELTHNWDEQSYDHGNQFGHLAYAVDDIYQVCQHLSEMGVTINRPPRDGHMAFIKDPNGISIELLQTGARLLPKAPWDKMENTGSW